jgi:hypothetical protein
MRLPTFRRPRYADVTATLALLFALGGTAYAVTPLDPDSVTTITIVDGAVTTPKIASEAVSNAKIAPAAVTSGKIADGTIAGSDLAGNSVSGAKVAAESLTLADLKGINQTGFISFTINAHSCGKLTFGVSGAVPGQAALLTWMATGDSIPTKIVVGPLEVVDSATVVGYACNNSSRAVSRTHLGVRIVTFG